MDEQQTNRLKSKNSTRIAKILQLTKKKVSTKGKIFYGVCINGTRSGERWTFMADDEPEEFERLVY